MANPTWLLGADNFWRSPGRVTVPGLGSLSPRDTARLRSMFFNSTPLVVVNAGALDTASYTPPGGAYYVDPVNGSNGNSGSISAPWQTAQYAITTAPTNAYIALRGGTYPEELSLAGGSKNITLARYLAEPVWFDGSAVIPSTSFAASGGVWVYNGYTYNFDHTSGFSSGTTSITINSSYPMASYPDQVFLDGVALTQVASAPGAGQFAVNTTAQTLTIGTNPTGHEVRVSALQRALICGTTGAFNMYGIGVRRYATSLPLQGTVFYGPHVGASLLENCVVQDCSGQGFSVDSNNGTTIRHCSALTNGMTGFHSNGANGIVYDSVLARGNNTQNFSSVSAGGVKLTNVNGFTVKNSTFDANLCNGIWTDITVLNGAIVNNICTGNNSVVSAQGWYGLIVELSDSIIIAGNTVSGSKYGITLLNTGRCQVWNNSVTGNTTYDIWASRDSRNNTNSSNAACPWITQLNVICNNVTDAASSGSVNLFVKDQVTANGTAGSALVSDAEGNVFPVATGGQVVQWGAVSYTSAANWNTATGNSWVNDTTTATPAHAVGLPTAVAAATGQTAGTRSYGPFN